MIASKARAALLCCACSAAACEDRSPTAAPALLPSPSATPKPSPTPKAPQLLFLPDGGDRALEGAPGPVPLVPSAGRCPVDMVDVAGRFCIDRYEAELVDARLGRSLSPYYAPRRSDVIAAFEAFRDSHPARAPELPIPPSFQSTENFSPRAASRAGVVPNGYVSGLLAAEACNAAGKRLCSLAEWVGACRGRAGRQFPYGDGYEAGACNVFREAHPAAVLHGDASKNHLDPRLNLVVSERGPLLRRTGASTRCRSEWGADAVFDMVGNLDEWLDDAGGSFAGGFYARATEDGCDARISDHTIDYFDYSTGVRCCR